MMRWWIGVGIGSGGTVGGFDKQERISNSNMKRSFVCVEAQNKCFSFTKSTWDGETVGHYQ